MLRVISALGLARTLARILHYPATFNIIMSHSHSYSHYHSYPPNSHSLFLSPSLSFSLSLSHSLSLSLSLSLPLSLSLSLSLYPLARLQESIGVLTNGSAGSGSAYQMLLEAYMDCDTNTLVTVTGERSFKLWDIGVLSHYQHNTNANNNSHYNNFNNNNNSSHSINSNDSNMIQNSPTPTTPVSISSDHTHTPTQTTHTPTQTLDQKKNRFFKFSTSKKNIPDSHRTGKGTLPGTCIVPCVGRIAAGSALPSTLSRFVSCAILDHPRYPFGTFVLVSKTNSIGIVQVNTSTHTILLYYIIINCWPFFH